MMAMSKKPKYERSDDYRYQYIRAHPGFMASITSVLIAGASC